MPTTEPELAFLLGAYQLRDQYLAEQFDAATRPLLRSMARKRAWGLPKDAIEEVVQEVFLALLKPGAVSFDPQRGTARQYLMGRLLNAVKSVQIANGLRRTGSDFEEEAQREFVPLDDARMPLSNVIPFAAINARQLVGKMFADAGAEFQDACLRVWGDGESQAAVAEEMGLTRFALARKLVAVKATSVQYASCA